MTPSILQWATIALLPAYTLARVSSGSVLNTRGANLDWAPCFGALTANRTECVIFDTLLDYNNPNAGNANLAVIRYKAFEEPYLGTLWFNSGSSGLVDLTLGLYGELLSNLTGGHYDIASWDSRGAGYSLPHIGCFDDDNDEAAFWNKSAIAFNVGFEVKGHFTAQADIDAFLGQADAIDSKLVEFGQRCATRHGDMLKYFGTAASVRDMIAINDALHGPGTPINYYGLSYGTVIGSYFVNMFPDRVGRIVLDGVVNPAQWSQSPTYKNWGSQIQDADKIVMAFAQLCADAGEDCVIPSGKTATEVYHWLVDLISVAHDAHISGSPITSAGVRQMLWIATFDLRQWRWWAQNLVATFRRISSPSSTDTLSRGLRPVVAHEKLAERRKGRLAGTIHRSHSLALRNPTQRQISWPEDIADIRNLPDEQTFPAIECSDAGDPSYTTKDVLEELIRVTQQVSATFGPLTWVNAGLYCHRWPARAVERYVGPWNHTLRNPIVVIGNQADAVTPLSGANFVADQLGSSAVLIEEEGFGHTSFAMYSNCTSQTVATYLLAGQLLQTHDKLCATERPIFPSDTDPLHIPFIGNIPAVSGPVSIPSRSNNTSSGFVQAFPHIGSFVAGAVMFTFMFSL